MLWLRVRRSLAVWCLGAAGMLAVEGYQSRPAFVPDHHASQFLIGEDGDPGARRDPSPPAPAAPAAAPEKARLAVAPGTAPEATPRELETAPVSAPPPLVVAKSIPDAAPQPPIADLSPGQSEDEPRHARRPPASRWRAELAQSAWVGALPPPHPRARAPRRVPAPRKPTALETLKAEESAPDDPALDEQDPEPDDSDQDEAAPDGAAPVNAGRVRPVQVNPNMVRDVAARLFPDPPLLGNLAAQGNAGKL